VTKKHGNKVNKTKNFLHTLPTCVVICDWLVVMQETNSLIGQWQ